MENEHEKIGTITTIFGALFFILADILGVLATAFFVVGSPAVKNIFGIIQDSILWLLKAHGNEALSKYIIKRVSLRLIPAIPVLTATWCLSIYQHNHPKLAAIAQIKTAKIPKQGLKTKAPQALFKKV